MKNFALIGLGFVSFRHQQAIKEIGGKVILTCDNDPEKKADFLDYQKMFQSPLFAEVDWVSICTPNDLHCLMADEAIRYGKKVLCEKPLGLSSEEVDCLSEGVYTVLQLRYHPAILKLKKDLYKPSTASLLVKVKRDKSYWDGWKGKEKQSGGILFNLGIHYFDLLIHLLGDEYRIVDNYISKDLAVGTIEFSDTLVDYHLEIMPTNEGQDRSLEIDNQVIELSRQDNLALEGLHTKVYEELLKGNGVSAEEALKSIKLVERLKYAL